MKTINKLLLLLLAVLLSVSIGLYNNFPVTYPDSASYLYSGIENSLPQDRPIFYGWFLRYTHFNDNLLFSILAQGLLSSFTIFLLFKYFSPARNKYFHFIAAILFLTCLTGYSFYVSFLMPDIFSFIFLVTLILLFFANLSKVDLAISTCICIYSVIVHNSHFPLLFICLLLLGFLFVLRDKNGIKRQSTKKLLNVVGVLVFSIVITLAVNFIFTSKIFLSRNGHIFFTSRLHELHILESFLNEKCGSTNYVLCPYKDSIPADFIWDASSPLHKTGGFENSGPAYSKMIGDLIKSPKYVKKIAVASISSTLQQIGSFEIEPQHPNILAYIKENFSIHALTQDISFQNRGGTVRRLNFEKLNFVQNLVVLGSFSFLSILIIFYPTINKPHRNIIIFVFWALLFNAFICSTFSTVLTRYQGRIIFILPLILILIAPGIDWKHFKSLIFTSSNNQGNF